MDCLNRCYVGPAQSKTQIASLTVCGAEGRYPTPLTAHEGEEGNLVDGGKEMRAAHTGGYVLGSRSSVSTKPLGKPRIEGIELIRVAIVAQIPGRIWYRFMAAITGSSPEKS